MHFWENFSETAPQFFIIKRQFSEEKVLLLVRKIRGTYYGKTLYGKSF